MARSAHSTVERVAALAPSGRAGKAIVAGAAALTAAAVWNNFRTRRAEASHPPMGRFLEIDGARVHYLERGTGSPVVLLHGNVVSADDFVWSGVLDRAGKTHRVVAFDRPGYGYSDRPAGKLWTAAAQAQLLRRAFAELGLERPVVVGHSWGTLVALALALDHPDAVGGLVLMSGYYKPTARLDVPLAALAAVPLLGDILRHTISPLFGAAMLPLNVKTMFSPQAVPNRFHNKFAYGFPVRPSQIRAESQDAATMVPGAAALRRRYDELKLPITIMAGVDDRIADVDNQSAWFHDAVPGSELILIPDAGHMVHYAVPGQVADAIDEVARQAQVTRKVSAAPRPVVELGQRPAA